MRFLFSLLLLFSTLLLYGESKIESQYYKFRVYLKDKGVGEYSVDNPLEFLSEKAVERKKTQNVKIDESDFPISQDYFNLVLDLGGDVVSHSKWFKTLVVQVSDSQQIENIKLLDFVDSVKYVWKGNINSYLLAPRPRLKNSNLYEKASNGSYYGHTESQFLMHNANILIDAGYRGKGIDVGVIDAGYTNFDVMPVFDTVRLLGYEDFVPEGDIFATSDHGTKVLSTMTVEIPGQMIGSAPEASYWLLRSEDVKSEYPVEEDYWVRAIEFADSLGLDVVNTSLGYNEFDDKLLNYSHSDLTGNVSIMSLAADMAYDKGLINVISAGNEGNKLWQKSTPPGDARNIITVGAIGSDSIIASFSSHGLMADGRIKPDIVSVGKSTVTIGSDGTIGNTSGTSLSSPFMAGLVASLWSVNPNLHRSQLIDIIIRSSDRYLSPDSIYGYGIPDYHRALSEVLKTIPSHEKKVEDCRLSIYPELFGGYRAELVVPEFRYNTYSILLLDESGALISESSFEEGNTVKVPIPKEIRKLNNYLHFVLHDPFQQFTYRIKL